MIRFFGRNKKQTPDAASGPWTAETHAIGIRSLDDEHQHLSDCVLDLRNAIAEHLDITRVLKILEITRQNAKAHCEHEERILESNEYPQLKEHQEAHRKWLAEIDDLYQSIYARKVSIQMAPKKLEAWFSEHIIHEDKKYAPFLRRCNVQ